MSYSIFTKPMNSISYDDIKRFFDVKIAENVKVDYKEDFPINLGKYISGFANTYGGILLIGIKANKTTNIPTSIPGIDLNEGLEEKVINICQSTINPYIIPEVCVCPFKSNNNLSNEDKAVILIRIDESFDKPHFYIKKKDHRAYIRIHNKTEVADRRTIKELFSEENTGKEILEKIIKTEISPRILEGYRIVYIIPASPTKPIIKFDQEMDKFLKEGTPGNLRFGNYKPIRDGGLFEYKSEFSALITREGLVSFREKWSMMDNKPNPDGDISVDRTMLISIKILRYAKSIYEKVGYYGKLVIGLGISGTKNKYLFSTEDRDLSNGYTTLDKSVIEEQIFSFEDFATIKKPTFSIFESFLRSFGLVTDKKTLSSWIDKYLL